MAWTLLKHRVSRIELGPVSRLEGGRLSVSLADLEAAVRKEGDLRLLRAEAVHPGESVRFGPVLDAVEPRAKDDPGLSAFPGWTGVPGAAGQGRTHALGGMALMAVARLPGAQEGIVDMGPEAAPYCPFARTRNLVLVLEAAEGADRLAADGAIRRTLLRIAEDLGSLGRGRRADEEESWGWPPAPSALPRAGLVYQIQSQGDLRRTYLNGGAADSLSPKALNPLEVLDGAVVSGNFVLPSNKTCTYIHQNHPLIRQMLRRHGRELDFAGVILSNEAGLMEEKERSAERVVELARQMGLGGAVINQEGGANTLADVMLLCRLLTRSGVKTVLLVNEFAGSDGTTPSLAETTPEAAAVVSAGNNDHRLSLPAREGFIGFSPIQGIEGEAGGKIALPLARVYASTNQLGFNSLSCRER